MKINRRNSARDKNKLTDKENRFVIEYLRDYNGLQAAIRAGYSEATAGQIAYELLHRERVRNKIDEHEKDLATRFLVSRERLMKELSITGYADMADYVDVEDGEITVKDFKSLPPQITRAIKKIGWNSRTGKWTLELHDGLKAKELMGKEVGMFKDRVEHTGVDGQPLIPTSIVIEFTGDKNK